MVLVKILKRRDAASVIVAIVVGLQLLQVLSAVTTRLSANIAGVTNGQYSMFSPPGVGWKGEYLLPVVNFLLTLVVLELLAWAYILLSRALSGRRLPFRKR